MSAPARGRAVPTLRVMLFRPGRPPEVVDVARDLMAFRALLETDTLDWTRVVAGDRNFALVCDDAAVEKGLAPCRVMRGDPRWPDWVMQGPFFVARIEGEDEESIEREDIALLVGFFDALPGVPA